MELIASKGRLYLDVVDLNQSSFARTYSPDNGIKVSELLDQELSEWTQESKKIVEKKLNNEHYFITALLCRLEHSLSPLCSYPYHNS